MTERRPPVSTPELCESWRPLGEALADYSRGLLAAHFLVRSSVEADREIPVSTFYRDGIGLSPLDRKALRSCNGRVLDAGAGAGAHSLWLQDKGLDVTALDISPQAVEAMLNRGVNKTVAASLQEYKPAEKFDTILLMMNGIGVAGNLNGLKNLLHHCKQLLNPGGQIIFDSSDISYVKPKVRAQASLPQPEDDSYYGVVHYQLLYRQLTGKVYPWLFIDQGLMQKMAAETGYKMKILFEAREQYLARLWFD